MPLDRAQGRNPLVLCMIARSFLGPVHLTGNNPPILVGRVNKIGSWCTEIVGNVDFGVPTPDHVPVACNRASHDHSGASESAVPLHIPWSPQRSWCWRAPDDHEVY